MQLATLANFVNSKEFALFKDYLVDRADDEAVRLIKRDVKNAHEANLYSRIETVINKITSDLIIKEKEG